MSNSIKISVSEFPKSVEGLEKLFMNKSNYLSKNNKDNYKFFYFSKNGEKIDISDLNISSIPNNSHKDKTIDVFIEKFEIKIDYYNTNQNNNVENEMMNSVILAERELYSNDFQKLFECISEEILKSLSNTQDYSFSLDEIVKSYLDKNNQSNFENFIKIVKILQKKVEQLEKEKEIVSLILSDNENFVLKQSNENIMLKKDLEHLTSEYINLKQNHEVLFEETRKLREQSKQNEVIIDNLRTELSLMSQGCFVMDYKQIRNRYTEIVKYCNEIQSGLNERKRLIQNENLIKFIESNNFRANLNDINDTLIFVSEYMRKLSFIPLLLFDPANLSNLHQFLQKTLRRVYLCSICNEYKSVSNLESKLCERHYSCDTCYSTLKQKLLFLRKNVCFCQIK